MPHSLYTHRSPLLVPYFAGWIWLVLLFILAASTHTAVSRPLATTFTVCTSGCDHTTMQAALNAAQNGDTVRLLVTSPHTEGDIVVEKSVTIEGLGETTTILQAAASPGAASSRVFFVAAGVEVSIREMTIRHGDAGSNRGGGLYNEGGDVTLANVQVRDNEAGNGGGIYSAGGTITLHNSEVSDNVADAKGGGVFNGGALVWRDSELLHNEANHQGGGLYNSGSATVYNGTLEFNGVGSDTVSFPSRGGGIYNEGALAIVDSLIGVNKVIGDQSGILPGGGGIYSSGELHIGYSAIGFNETIGLHNVGAGLFIEGGSAYISHTSIGYNDAASSSNGGGALLVDADVTIVDSAVEGNSAFSGGGLIVPAGSVRLVNTAVYDNQAHIGAGLFFCSSGNALANVTISNNEASGDGGGVYICPIGEATFANVTISDNDADITGDNDGDGGGLYLATQDSNKGMATLRNTLIAGNRDGSPDRNATRTPDCHGTVDSAGYNLIGDLGFAISGSTCAISGDTSGNLLEVEAQLGPLQDNGGPTLTHALLPQSPAINAGHPDGCRDESGQPLPRDQRGGLRPDRCDIGAYEAEALAEIIYLPSIVRP